jgi:hypothetical protein
MYGNHNEVLLLNLAIKQQDIL